MINAYKWSVIQKHTLDRLFILFREWICGLKELKFVYMATRLTVRGLHYNTLKLREGNYTTSMATVSLVADWELYLIRAVIVFCMCVCVYYMSFQ